MTDVVGTAGVEIEPAGADQLAALLETDVLAALGKIEGGLTNIEGQLTGLTGLASTLGEALADAAQNTGPIQLAVDGTAIQADIDAAVTAASSASELSPDLILDTTQAEAELGAIGDAVAISIDTSQAEVDLAAVGDDVPPVVVPVELDAAAATEELDNLGQSATAAAAPVAQADSSVEGLTGSLIGASTAGGSFSGVMSAIPKGAIPGAAAVLAVGAATDSFFDSAVNAEAATIRFNKAFGDTADEVNNIDVGSLDMKLTELNASLGSSTTQVRNVLATFATLGNQSGATGDQVAMASEQLVALSANAVALNPNLGSVGDVAGRLDKLLGKGGPRLGNYGISLKAVDINARAAEIALARGSDTVTEFDKRAAGAALATEQLGGSFQKNISDASKNPLVQLKQMSLELAKLGTEIGKPLVAPIIDILKDAQPALLAVTKVVGALGSGLVAIAGPIISAISPVITILANALVPILSQIPSLVAPLTPVFEVLGGILGTVAGAVGKLIGALGPLITALGSALSSVLVPLQPLFDGLGLAVGAVAQVLGILIDGPIKFLIEGLALTVQAIGDTIAMLLSWIPGLEGAGAATDEVAGLQYNLASQTEAATAALFEQATSTEGLSSAFAGLNTAFAKYLTTTSVFAKNDLVSSLNEAGISAETLFGLLEKGTSGALNNYIVMLAKAGKVKIEIDGVEQTTQQLENQKLRMDDLIRADRLKVTSGQELVDAYQVEAAALDATSKKTIDNLVATGKYTQAQVDAAVKVRAANDPLITQTEILETLNTKLPEVNAKVEAQGKAVETTEDKNAKLASTLVDLGNKALGAGVSEDELKAKSGELGVDMQKLKGFTDGVSKAFDDFRDSLTKSLPEVQKVVDDAAKDLDAATNPQTIINNLQLQNEALTNFRGNVQFLIDGHYNDLAKIAIQRGPEFTNNLVRTIQTGRPGLAAELNHNLGAYQTNLDNTKTYLSGTAAPALFDANKAVAEQASTGFGANLDIQGKVHPVFDAAGKQIAIETPGITGPAGTAGTATTDAFGQPLDLAGKVDEAGKAATTTVGQLGLSGSPINQAAGSAGGNIAYSFMQGISTIFTTFAQTGDRNFLGKSAADLVAMIERVVREKSGTKSPSVMFQEIGQDWMSGLGVGIEQGAADIADLSGDTVGQLIDAWRRSIGGNESFLRGVESLNDTISHSPGNISALVEDAQEAISRGIDPSQWVVAEDWSGIHGMDRNSRPFPTAAATAFADSTPAAPPENWTGSTPATTPAAATEVTIHNFNVNISGADIPAQPDLFGRRVAGASVAAIREIISSA